MYNKIKELRKEHNLSQQDLAHVVRVRRETIIHLEKGKYNPSLLLAKKISVALSSWIEEVFFFENSETRET